MKTRSVPASELDPKKGLRASDYMDGKTREGSAFGPGGRPAKTMGLKLEATVHDRLESVMKRHGMKSKKATALRALELGLKALEETYPGSQG